MHINKNYLQEFAKTSLSRRKFLMRSAGLGTGIVASSAALVGCPPLTPTEVNVFNFALNLEYLEAEFYLRAIGRTLTDTGANPGTVTGGGAVPFTTDAFRQYAEEIAADEAAHVSFLRDLLGVNAVDEPAIDLDTSFTAAAMAAGLIGPGETFDPFADEISFLLGAFIFEDVGVTAYKGATPLLETGTFIEAAAGILAVEGYHASNIRTILFALGTDTQNAANAISDARDSLDGPEDLDQGVTEGGMANIVPTDDNGIAFSRTTDEVLHIVYLNPNDGVSSGGFFPNGLNGAIVST